MQVALKLYAGIILGTYFILMFPIILISLLFPLRIRLKSFISWFWKGFSELMLRVVFFTKIKFTDDRSLSIKNKTPVCRALYIANHSNFADIPLILTQIQVPPLMKKEILKIPFFGLYALASGAIAVDRTKASSRRIAREQLVARMDNGICVQYYPEGTRSKSGSPKEFHQIKTSLIRHAYELNIPVVPTAMCGTHKLIDQKLNIHLGQTIALHFAKEISPENFENVDDFCEACWSQVQKDVQRLQTILGE